MLAFPHSLPVLPPLSPSGVDAVFLLERAPGDGDAIARELLALWGTEATRLKMQVVSPDARKCMEEVCRGWSGGCSGRVTEVGGGGQGGGGGGGGGGEGAIGMVVVGDDGASGEQRLGMCALRLHAAYIQVMYSLQNVLVVEGGATVRGKPEDWAAALKRLPAGYEYAPASGGCGNNSHTGTPTGASGATFTGSGRGESVQSVGGGGGGGWGDGERDSGKSRPLGLGGAYLMSQRGARGLLQGAEPTSVNGVGGVMAGAQGLLSGFFSMPPGRCLC